jgi:hypothetical protein
MIGFSPQQEADFTGTGSPFVRLDAEISPALSSGTAARDPPGFPATFFSHDLDGLRVGASGNGVLRSLKSGELMGARAISRVVTEQGSRRSFRRHARLNCRCRLGMPGLMK